eukprot:TRINITY_DN54733_c0_g1_i1.p1 TRINITY_DN54733_c0_g1~~TRINITY_DN54733_c0_g1_i1.p1  ORF type:complete len:188 (+),score=50.53 TRINITY_DN54733_c0_g1_i1:51-614(+)
MADDAAPAPSGEVQSQLSPQIVALSKFTAGRSKGKMRKGPRRLSRRQLLSAVDKVMNSPKFVLQKMPVSRHVRQAMEDAGARNMHTSASFLEAMQDAAEAYVVRKIRDAATVAVVHDARSLSGAHFAAAEGVVNVAPRPRVETSFGKVKGKGKGKVKVTRKPSPKSTVTKACKKPVPKKAAKSVKKK